MTAFHRPSARAFHLLCITCAMLLLAYALNSAVEVALLQGRVPVRYVSAVSRPTPALDPKQLAKQLGLPPPGPQNAPQDEDCGGWDNFRPVAVCTWSSTVIQQRGPTRFEVSGPRDQQTDSASAACRPITTRVVPALQNGKLWGFKLFAIDPGSIADRFGLSNGDIVRSINGMALNEYEKVLEFYAQFEKASRVQLVLERNGKTLRYTYDFRE